MSPKNEMSTLEGRGRLDCVCKFSLYKSNQRARGIFREDSKEAL